jgi:hypothetical protein
MKSRGVSSNTSRWARRRPSGSGGSHREASTTCAPGGGCSTRPARTSMAAFEVRSCTSSNTRTNSRSRPVSGSVARARDARRCSASSSARSNATHANGRSSCWAHSSTVVVLPYPAGATSSASETSRTSISRRTRRVRATRPQPEAERGGEGSTTRRGAEGERRVAVAGIDTSGGPTQHHRQASGPTRGHAPVFRAGDTHGGTHARGDATALAGCRRGCRPPCGGCTSHRRPGQRGAHWPSDIDVPAGWPRRVVP